MNRRSSIELAAIYLQFDFSLRKSFIWLLCKVVLIRKQIKIGARRWHRTNHRMRKERNTYNKALSMVVFGVSWVALSLSPMSSSSSSSSLRFSSQHNDNLQWYCHSASTAVSPSHSIIAIINVFDVPPPLTSKELRVHTFILTGSAPPGGAWRGQAQDEQTGIQSILRPLPTTISNKIIATTAMELLEELLNKKWAGNAGWIVG